MGSTINLSRSVLKHNRQEITRKVLYIIKTAVDRPKEQPPFRLFDMHQQLQIQNIQSNTTNFKECPKVSTRKSRTKTCINPMYRLPQCHDNLQVEYQNIYQVNQIEHHIVTTCIHMQESHQVFSNPKLIQSDNSDTSKVKTQLITTR